MTAARDASLYSNRVCASGLFSFSSTPCPPRDAADHDCDVYVQVGLGESFEALMDQGLGHEGISTSWGGRLLRSRGAAAGRSSVPFRPAGVKKHGVHLAWKRRVSLLQG